MGEAMLNRGDLHIAQYPSRFGLGEDAQYIIDAVSTARTTGNPAHSERQEIAKYGEGHPIIRTAVAPSQPKPGLSTCRHLRNFPHFYPCQEPGIAILSVNGDGSLTLADNLEDDTAITWAIRQPLAAEQQMRASLTALAASHRQPAFALMFSCIGRGPLFYGSDDRDLLAFREAFPETPLLGAYGTSQIFPHAGKNRLYHNAALTLLFESSHV